MSDILLIGLGIFSVGFMGDVLRGIVDSWALVSSLGAFIVLVAVIIQLLRRG